jgi:hypothetical protein
VDDDELLMQVGEVLAADEEPLPRVLAAAQAAFCWLCVDDVVAEMIFDSLDFPAASGMRCPRPARLLAYGGEDLLIECEIGAGGLHGQVIPASPLLLELRCGDGRQRPVTVDDQGRFTVAPAPAGPVSIRCRRAGRPAVVTPWLLA